MRVLQSIGVKAMLDGTLKREIAPERDRSAASNNSPETWSCTKRSRVRGKPGCVGRVNAKVRTTSETASGFLRTLTARVLPD
jgi:hypothetical protein